MDERTGALVVPLSSWTALHPAALAAVPGLARGERPARAPSPRRAALANALAEANRRWGNPVDDQLQEWLAGGEAVVTGQQPGLLGGPLLTLVKACAVAAEVRRRREAGRRAVGFLWLATGDDDLAEMGWGRLALGEDLAEVREAEWRRGGALGGAVALSSACRDFLTGVAEGATSAHARAALELAASCYAPGALLGEATAQFLARLLVGSGVVLVDACEKEVARAAAPVVDTVLERLPQAWEVLAEGAERMTREDWPVALRVTPGQLPLFRVRDGRRRRIASADGACPAAVREDHVSHPEGYLPNVWLRPLVQDTALGSDTVLLGGGELAYHIQAAALWELAGLKRPAWRLRPHVTIVTSAERRLVEQLRVAPEDMLSAGFPGHLRGAGKVRKGLARLRNSLTRPLAELEAAARAELPALQGEVAATRGKLDAAVAWLEGRAQAAAARAGEVESARWRRLRAFLRPHSRPQERHLSVLAPVLRLGLDWPRELAASLDPDDPGMHLLFWEEGGPW
jgi:bacillithiol synthase